MAELTTIARPYAEAAFDLARERNALAPWAEMLRFAATIVRDPRVADALDDPRLGSAERQSLLLGIVGDRLNEDARSFIRVLIEADRIAVLPEIAELFETLKNQFEGVAQADIETAYELSDAQRSELAAALERRFGKRIETRVRVNPDLVGGARVTVGDAVIDASVAAKLDAMHRQLRA
ncbi:MAG TPA: F0F1 ATP synthase subunit delta [Casimicrobiaceae bacterium]|nr:F0F1 ATP synthase subunit delta [Casimicrobiaceae bacterium]